MAVDTDKLQEFLGQFVTDLGATFAAGNVVTGHHLGLYRALAAGPARAAEFAQRTSTNSRGVRVRARHAEGPSPAMRGSAGQGYRSKIDVAA